MFIYLQRILVLKGRLVSQSESIDIVRTAHLDNLRLKQKAMTHNKCVICVAHLM